MLSSSHIWLLGPVRVTINSACWHSVGALQGHRELCSSFLQLLKEIIRVFSFETWRSEASFSRQKKVSAGVAFSRGSPGAAVPCLSWFLWLLLFIGLWVLLLHLCSVTVVPSALGLVHSSSSFLSGQIMVFRPWEDDRGRIPNSGKLIHSFGLYVGTSRAKPLCHGRWCW